MSATLLRTLLDQSTFYVTENLNALRPGDDLVAIPNGGNSVNWILGHIAYWRNEMIELLGEARVWRGAVGQQYRGNPGGRREGAFRARSAMALSEIVDGFHNSGRCLAQILESRSIDSETATEMVGLLGHEIYHAGQLGVLHRIAGHAGAL